ncbi:uncharacterized protein LOC143891700 [Tasmannia lanceolata]|uniref:uncharacterized protein LOC143891700 n=1 Tax=Tasmannia lanceolata TaxID=3420 RepID=UPI004064755A
MHLGMDRLVPVEWSIYEFSSGSIRIEGRIDLPVTFGTEPHQKTIMQTFLVVKVPSTYNATIARSALNKLEAVVSTPHLKVKFPTNAGVGEVRGDQERARNCYAYYAKVVKKAKESLQIAGTDPRSDNYQTRGEPVEELTQVLLFEEDNEWTVQIGSLLTGKYRTNLVNFLKPIADVFAWSTLDMPDIPTDVAIHRLSVDHSHWPVKQKKRNFTSERQKAIKEEVDKLLQAGFIREIHYSEWLANVVMVKKSSKKWRICVDFANLNKACPKDHYPLPRINMLIVATSGHEMLSFMHAFSGYNEIRMYPPPPIFPKRPSSQNKGYFVIRSCHLALRTREPRINGW